MSNKQIFAGFALGFASCLAVCAISVKIFIARKQKELNVNFNDLSKLGNMKELAEQANKVFSEIQKGNISNEQLKSAMRGFPPVTGSPLPNKKKK